MVHYDSYEHHGATVMVRRDLAGKHREHCLCHSCVHFHPAVRERNCKMASVLYAICVAWNLVTPVWECPKFIPNHECHIDGKAWKEGRPAQP